MRRLAVGIVTLVLLVPVMVWARGKDHGTRPVSSDTWPKGLAELVNAENRVHGYSVNREDHFFFKGDTAALNDFLTRYAQLPVTKLHVAIHPGRLEVRSMDGQPLDVAADWQLYATPFTREQVQRDGVKPGPFVTRVDVWLGGSVKLEKLAVPEKVSVESGGEIEAFVKKHAKPR